MIRIVYLAAYAALAALGEALVARPALLWLRSQGVARATLGWDVPLGWAAFLLAVAVALLTLWLALQAALARRPHVPQHVAFLFVLGFSFAVRWAAADPRPPADPVPSLMEGLRAAAEELDRSFADAGAYASDAAHLDAALSQLPPPGFRRLGRAVPLHAHVLLDASGPQADPLPGDRPATIYIAISRDRSTAWLTALGLGRIVQLRSGKPATVEAHAGTHSLPGRDHLVPAYPGMRSVTGDPAIR